MYFCGLKKKYIHDEIFIPNIIDNIRICLFSHLLAMPTVGATKQNCSYILRAISGPNAFPIPEMRDGRVSERYEWKYGANTIIIRVTRPGTSWGVPCCPSSGAARESK